MRPVLMSAGFPRFGTTVHQGYMFYRGRLVSESIKRFDPLTPMSDPDLVRFLGRQTPHRIALLNHATLLKGPEAAISAIEAFASEGAGHVLLDTTDDGDVVVSASIAAEMPCVVVASDPLVIAYATRLGRAEASEKVAWPQHVDGPAAVLAGSVGPVVLAQLAADGRTRRREPNHVYTLQQAAGVVNYAFDRIALDPQQASGENVRVAVIDTAIDDTNPALAGVIAGQFDAMPGVPVEKRDHGTSVDGLIAGVGALEGMAPGARIYHARAFEGGKSTMDVILSALDWAADQNVSIINMSFVGPRNELLGTACRNARALGMVLVAAAGNNGPKAPYGYPAAFDGVLAVTATDAKDQLMPQANRGPYVFISAPGVEMVAPSGAGTDVVTGTSFAAAIVSGAIANMLHVAPERSADSIEKALAATAKDLGGHGRDSDFGYGLLNAKAAEAAKD